MAPESCCSVQTAHQHTPGHRLLLQTEHGTATENSTEGPQEEQRAVSVLVMNHKITEPFMLGKTLKKKFD